MNSQTEYSLATKNPVLSRDSTEELIDSFAAFIRDRKLEVPARFFLEAHLPLTTVFHSFGLLVQPIATPLFGADRISALLHLLSQRENVVALIERIDQQVEAGRARTNNPEVS